MKDTAFVQKVRAVVSGIAKGDTLTYKQVAERAGYPGASRAVGTVMKNNYDPGIPCHRVVKSDGTVGEYNRGGPEAKKAILRAEGVVIGN